jgi:hypothetical protein
MSKPWTELLTPSQVAFMNQIIEQVPETMGARDVFIGCLQGLADGSAPPKFRYIIAMEGDVAGTNDTEKAREAAADETYYVLDTVANQWLTTADEDDDTEIMELS